MGSRNGCVVDEENQQPQEDEQRRQQEQQRQTNNGGYVKVMTDEQMEILRHQISVYATICEQLVEMHKALTTQQVSIAGMRLGNMYCDPLMGSGHKIATRQRWAPSQMQLQILESIFAEGYGTPSKQKIKEIASDLVRHGPISETNVYNWFQNRRARSKRKQQVAAPNVVDSEVETEVESPREKKAKVEDSVEKRVLHEDGFGFQGQEVSSSMCFLDSQSCHGQSSENFKSPGNSAPFSFFENMLANSRIEHLIGKMEGPDFSPFHMNEGFDVMG